MCKQVKVMRLACEKRDEWTIAAIQERQEQADEADAGDGCDEDDTEGKGG